MACGLPANDETETMSTRKKMAILPHDSFTTTSLLNCLRYVPRSLPLIRVAPGVAIVVELRRTEPNVELAAVLSVSDIPAEEPVPIL